MDTAGRQAGEHPNKRCDALACRTFHGSCSVMNDTLLFLGVIVAWFLVVRFLFPRFGIRG